MIKRAVVNDIEGLSRLLKQVQQIHFEGRPDIFKSGSQKYTEIELEKIIENDNTPIYVYADDNNHVVGYVFCIIEKTVNSNTQNERTTIYIDDLCVDSSARGQGIGKSLFEHVKKLAIDSNYDGITLNVWSFNSSAMNFYEKLGMTPLKTTMEYNIKGNTYEI